MLSLTSEIDVCQQVDKLGVFESSMKTQDERRFHTCQNVFLIHDVTLLAILYNSVFLNTFKGETLIRYA